MIYVAFKIKISGRNRVRISTLKKTTTKNWVFWKNKINQYLHGIRSEPQRSIKHQTSSIWSINLNNEVCTMNVTECQEVCRWIAKRTIKSNRIASIETSEAEISKGGIERCISKAWYLGDCVCILCILYREHFVHAQLLPVG